MRSGTITNLLTNGKASFKWKLHCHWPISQRQHQITVTIKGLRCPSETHLTLKPRDISLVHNIPLQWRHNGRDSVSNHQPHPGLFKRRSKKTSKLRVTGLCVGNSPVTGEFPAQMASNAENVSNWWCHQALQMSSCFETWCRIRQCVKCQIDWVTDKYVLGKRDITRFGFKMRFGRIFYITLS